MLQVWYFILQYLDSLSERGMSLVECLSFLFQLSFSQLGKVGGPITSFYATETYITHFLEAARFPKVPVLAGRKVNFTLRPVKSADSLVDTAEFCPNTVRWGVGD